MVPLRRQAPQDTALELFDPCRIQVDAVENGVIPVRDPARVMAPDILKDQLLPLLCLVRFQPPGVGNPEPESLMHHKAVLKDPPPGAGAARAGTLDLLPEQIV